MSRTIRINEYYDLFDVKKAALDSSISMINGEELPRGNKDTFKTNPFSGFNNFEQSSAYSSVQNIGSLANQRDLIQITGKIRAPQANNSVYVDEQGSILCYPPPVSVPWWDKVIFRNFDYTFQPHDIDPTEPNDSSANNYKNLIDNIYLWHAEHDQRVAWAADGSTSTERREVWENYFVQPENYHVSSVECAPNNLVLVQPEPSFNSLFPKLKTVIKDYSQVPLFLKFDNYQSRSKVIFSGCDKTRNPDIEFKFGYHHGNMEPIKLNLSLSAGNPLVDSSNTYDRFNQNLTQNEINKLLVKCYWCVEWIHEPI